MDYLQLSQLNSGELPPKPPVRGANLFLASDGNLKFRDENGINGFGKGTSFDEIDGQIADSQLPSYIDSRIQVARGTTSQLAATTPLEGEIVYATDTKILQVGDGTTAGGNWQVNGASISSDYTVLTTTFTDVPGLSIALNPGVYMVEWVLSGSLSSTALLKFQAFYTGSFGTTSGKVSNMGSTTSWAVASISASSNASVFLQTVGTTTAPLALAQLSFVSTTSGILKMQVAQSVSHLTEAAGFKAGSLLKVTRCS